MPSPDDFTGRHDFTGNGGLVIRALRNHNLWLVVTYLGLLLLMARAYA